MSSHPFVRSSVCASTAPLTLYHIHILSYLCLYLLLFDAVIDLCRSLLMGPKQTDDTGPLWLQDVPILIADNLVQFQDPGVEGEGC